MNMIMFMLRPRRSQLAYRYRWFLWTSAMAILTMIVLVGYVLPESAYAVNYSQKSLPPTTHFIFGTDAVGRDMFMRSLKGLSISLQVGLIAAFSSSLIALILGIGSAVFGGRVDKCILFLIDICMGIPHILLIIMIAVMVGGGMQGVVLGIAVTHWPRLARVIRAEILQLRQMPYILLAEKYGHSRWYISCRHFLPKVFPQYIIGLVLLFPHAIMHEAGISFLGYGLPLDMPAIGIILAESIKYIALGMWWIAFFPGMMLLATVLLFEQLGSSLRNILNPWSIHE